MKKIILIYRTDNWHSVNSKTLIATSDKMTTSVSLIKEWIEAGELEPLSKGDVDNLYQLSQTQGREDNFVLEVVGVNEFVF